MVFSRHDPFNEMNGSPSQNQNRIPARNSQGNTTRHLPSYQYEGLPSNGHQRMSQTDTGMSSFTQGNNMNLRQEITNKLLQRQLAQRKSRSPEVSPFQGNNLNVNSTSRINIPEELHRLQIQNHQQLKLQQHLQQQQQQHRPRQNIQIHDLFKSRKDKEKRKSTSPANKTMTSKAASQIAMNRPSAKSPHNGIEDTSPKKNIISDRHSPKRSLNGMTDDQRTKRSRANDAEIVKVNNEGKEDGSARSIELIHRNSEDGVEKETRDPQKNDGSHNSINDINLLLKAADDPKANSTNQSKTRDLSRNEKAPKTTARLSIDVDDHSTSNNESQHAVRSDREAFDLMVGLKSLVENEEGGTEVQEIFPGYVSCIPTLPSEPCHEERKETKMPEREANQENTATSQADASKKGRDVKWPTLLDKPKDKWIKTTPTYASPIDKWWPSNSAISRERRAERYEENTNGHTEVEVNISDSVLISAPPSMANRLSNSIEPGVLEKIPHCKVYQQSYLTRYGKSPPEPLFCCQVSEMFCNSTMVCCSICSTWRHIECGGHHARYSPRSNESEFVPICDRCSFETEIVNMFPSAEKRIKRQRIKHLIGQQATNAVIKQATQGRQGGVYKWPPGNVPSTHITAHIKNVHGRHERYEKQWADASSKLMNNVGTQTKEKIKARTKELQKILINLEDAEGEMDRRNIILFLDNDTQKQYPTGYETSRLNFFDVEEYNQNIIIQTKSSDATSKTSAFTNALSPSETNDNSSDKGNINKETETFSTSDDGIQKANGDTFPDVDETVVSTKEPAERQRHILNLDLNKQDDTAVDTSKEVQCKVVTESKRSIDGEKLCCIRPGCELSPRFDSLFCSDACGVSTLELDLLKSFEYTNWIHPFQLRL